jgi:hypothetical protein
MREFLGPACAVICVFGLIGDTTRQRSTFIFLFSVGEWWRRWTSG